MTRTGPAFIRTGECLTQARAPLNALYLKAREVCADGFPAEETRELPALYDYIALGFIEMLRAEIGGRLGLERAVLSRERFSAHGCGPVGLHDDFFRYPSVYFVIVVAHSGQLGLTDAQGVAEPLEVGEIVLLDPRRKHALVRVGTRAEDHIYDSTHRQVSEPDYQFLFLDFDVRRPDLRARFRAP